MLRPVKPACYIRTTMHKLNHCRSKFKRSITTCCLLLVLMSMVNHGFTMDILVLGHAQDAGYPQVDCQKPCCKMADGTAMVSSIAIQHNGEFWIVDATPDFTAQLAMARAYFPDAEFKGILLTHAHIGHYTGLMYLGREAMAANNIPVHCAPKMAAFLQSNGPWSQLVALNNIDLKVFEPNQTLELAEGLSITPLLVPHRDEFSETVGYHIEGPDKSALFIPDIDKWSQWDQDIVNWIQNVDIALLDATFYDGEELPGRDMSEIPHPFVVETMDLLSALPIDVRKRVHFIHFNHTNPLLYSAATRSKVLGLGFNVATQGQQH